MAKALKIIYMGAPEFAVKPFEKLIDEDYRILFTVTQPDRPKARGKKTLPTPLAEASEKYGTECLKPEQIRDNPEFIERLESAAPDLIVVAAYGKILPKRVLELPRLGCVNIHASLLPAYRGAAPVHRAIEAGDALSGVSLMLMNEGLDEGDVLAMESVFIEGLNCGEATVALSEAGAELLVRTLPQIDEGLLHAKPQDDSLATYAPQVAKSEGHIDFSTEAALIVRKIRAMTPSPGAYAFLGDAKVKIQDANESLVKASDTFAPGTVLSADANGIDIAAANGTVLKITRLQMPGKKALSVKEFLLGNGIDKGELFK